jgi:TolB protein
VPGEQLTQNDLFRIDADGTHRQRLTNSPHVHELGASWNAAGTAIVFMRTRAPFGPGSIWRMDPDGTNQVRLTSGIDARDPAWSPNGQRIAFTRFTSSGSQDIWTLRASDGRGRRQVTSFASDEFLPAWSPDGQTIAFTRGFRTGDAGDIWTVDVNGGNAMRLTSSAAVDFQASWAPDGSRIAFHRDLGSTFRIATIRPDGTGFRTLTTGHTDADPVYSPSGSSIAFYSDRMSGFLGDLWVMDSDGTDARRIRDLPYASTQPDWQAIPPP